MENEYKKVFDMIDFKSMEEFNEVMVNFEKAIADDLMKHFGKSEFEANHLVKKFDLWNEVKESPLVLHESSTKISLIILTQEEDLEAIGKFYDGYKGTVS